MGAVLNGRASGAPVPISCRVCLLFRHQVGVTEAQSFSKGAHGRKTAGNPVRGEGPAQLAGDIGRASSRAV